MTVATVDSPANAGDSVQPEDDSVARLVSSLRLTEDEVEDLLLSHADHVPEEGELMDVSPHTDEESKVAKGEVTGTQPTPGGEIRNAVNTDQVVLLDIQMVFHRGRGSLIKELAYKVWNTNQVFGLNLKHDTTDVPPHLIVRNGGRHHDVFTGLALESGEYDYDDKIVANNLVGYRVVLVKGANKKSALLKLYSRLNSSNDAKENTGAVYPQPFIVNIDGQTADEEDRRFCKDNGMTLATFSFPFVYEHMRIYLNMLHESVGGPTHNPADVIYTNNVLSNDLRHDVLGRGRVVNVCHSDHSCGGTVEKFGKKQRCSLLNLSILENLWYKGHDAAFRQLVKSTLGDVTQRRKGKHRMQSSHYDRQPSQWQRPREEESFYTEEYPQDYNTYVHRYEDRDQAGYYYSPADRQIDSRGRHRMWQSDGRDVYEESRQQATADCYNRREENTFHKARFDERAEMENRRDGKQTMDSDYGRYRDDWTYGYGGVVRDNRTAIKDFDNDRAYNDQQQALVLIIRNGRERRRKSYREEYMKQRVYKKQNRRDKAK